MDGDNGAVAFAKDKNSENCPAYQPLVRVTSKQSAKEIKKKASALIVQVLPPSPEDFCEVCDPVCADDLRLAILSTFCCWMLLGFFPILIGFVSIFYARKAKNTRNAILREKYSYLSRSISWVGMLLFTISLTLLVIVLATCGVL